MVFYFLTSLNVTFFVFFFGWVEVVDLVIPIPYAHLVPAGYVLSSSSECTVILLYYCPPFSCVSFTQHSSIISKSIQISLCLLNKNSMAPNNNRDRISNLPDSPLSRPFVSPYRRLCSLKHFVHQMEASLDSRSKYLL